MSKVTQQYELQIGARTAASWNRTLGLASKSLNGLGKDLKLLTSGLMANLSFSRISEFYSDAKETFTNFEQEMKNTSAIASATAMEYEQMEQAAREAGRTTTITAEDSAAALGYMSLAGWDVQSSLTGLLPILHLAEATQKDLQITSDLVTDSMSALNIQVEDLDSYLDKLTMTNNSANTSAEQLMEALVKTGGSARVLGVETNDLITALGILANNGLKGSEAGTALNSILKRLGSNSQAIKALDALGISLYDAQDKFIGFEALFSKINEGLAGKSADEKNAFMSKLGGRFFSQLQYLLDAVSDGTDSTSSSWDKLIGKIENSDGALEKMRDTATSSLKAAEELTKSAWADFQISGIDAFSEPLKEFNYYIAEQLPALSDELSDFEQAHHNEIRRFLEFASHAVIDLGEGVINLGGFILDNGPAISGILGGIIGVKAVNGIANLTGRVVELSTAAGGLLPLVTGFLTNPWTLAAVGIGAIAGVATMAYTAIEKSQQAAADAELEKHFGQIELSSSEIEEAVTSIFGRDNIQRAEQFAEQIEKLDSFTQQIDGNLSELNKYNWMIQSGIEINGNDRSMYQSYAEDLVKNVQDYLGQQEYTLSLSAQLLSGGSAGLDAQSIQYWNNQNQKATELGNELNAAIADALGDGIIDPEKELPHIMELQQQLIEMQQKVKQNQLDAQMELLGSDISSGTFEDIAKRVGEVSTEKMETLSEAMSYQMANYKAQYQSGDISKSQYNANIEDVMNNYNIQSGVIAGESFQTLLDNLTNRYGDDISDSVNTLAEKTKTAVQDAVMQGDFSGLDRTLTNISSGIPNEVKRNLEELLVSMEPQYEQLKELEEEYRKAGSDIPQAVIDGITQYDMYSALAGKKSAMWDVAANAINNDPKSLETYNSAKNAGQKIPEELQTAISENKYMIEAGVDELYLTADGRFRYYQAKGMHYTWPVQIEVSSQPTKPTAGINTIYDIGVKRNALGGIYNNPILTTFAENGPEAAIPINNSLRAKNLWKQTGKMIGADESAGANSVTYSPQIIVQGNANKDDLVAAQEIGLQRFKQLYKEMQRQDRRLSFQGA